MSETNPIEEALPPAPMGYGNLTTGPVLRTLVMFSLPALLSNVLQTFGSTINTIWVGQLLGETALAATANANMIVFLTFSAVFGFGMAATVKVGHCLGAGDLDGARRTFGTGTGFCTVVALAGSALGFILAEPLLDLLATPPSIRAEALAYLRVMFIGIPISTVQMMIAMGLRGAGDAKTPLYAVIATCILVIALNPVLILGLGPAPALGIAGSALANVLANVGGLLLLIGWTYWRDLPLRLRGREFAYLLPLRDELSYVLGKGIPMGAQMLLNTASGVVMVGLVNREGMLTTAAYGAIMQLWSYVQMPAFAISMAVSAMVAQNAGAGRHDRVGGIAGAGLWATAAITMALSVALLLYDYPLLALFLGEGSQALPIAARIQLLAIWAWVLSGIMMILAGVMRAYGDVMLPLIIMIVALYPARLGFYFVLYPALGADALWLAYPFGSAVALGLTWLAYARGGWRRERLQPAVARPAG